MCCEGVYGGLLAPVELATCEAGCAQCVKGLRDLASWGKVFSVKARHEAAASGQ